MFVLAARTIAATAIDFISNLPVADLNWVPPYGTTARDRRAFLITGSVARLVAVAAYNSLNCCPVGKRRPGIAPRSLATCRRP
jgi:hypothetical protein